MRVHNWSSATTASPSVMQDHQHITKYRLGLTPFLSFPFANACVTKSGTSPTNEKTHRRWFVMQNENLNPLSARLLYFISSLWCLSCKSELQAGGAFLVQHSHRSSQTPSCDQVLGTHLSAHWQLPVLTSMTRYRFFFPRMKTVPARMLTVVWRTVHQHGEPRMAAGHKHGMQSMEFSNYTLNGYMNL